MTLLGSLLNKGIKISKIIENDKRSPGEMQKQELQKLLKKAKSTQFGKRFKFSEILSKFDSSDKDYYKYFKQNVPVYNYTKIFAEWLYKSKEGESDVTWPGTIKYFALSSGTSEASSKYIPITKSMLKSNKRTSIRQIVSLGNYDLPDHLLTKGILMLGGSTALNKSKHYYEGDLSGIQASKIPFWFHYFYKPGKKIAQNKDWSQKLDEITLKAKEWDIGFIVGVPAWLQILMEKIIAHYKVNTIHDVWPNLQVFVHGGVSFEPYKKGFEKLLGKPLIYIETYLASEGFIAYQTSPQRKAMRLVMDNGLFFEFIPFTEENFNQEGEVVENPKTFLIDEVEEGVEYALLMSTNSGNWRYLIGDVIRFVSKAECEIVITGRTKHFLSLCGEHLSVENMTQAVKLVSEELNISIPEFTVSGITSGSLFAHKWYLGTDDKVDNAVLKEKLDENLKMLNDDYRVERGSALKDIMVETVQVNRFLGYMKSKGKEGGQNKFPRVMKKAQFEEWENFVQQAGRTENV